MHHSTRVSRNLQKPEDMTGVECHARRAAGVATGPAPPFDAVAVAGHGAAGTGDETASHAFG